MKPETAWAVALRQRLLEVVLHVAFSDCPMSLLSPEEVEYGMISRSNTHKHSLIVGAHSEWQLKRSISCFVWSSNLPTEPGTVQADIDYSLSATPVCS